MTHPDAIIVRERRPRGPTRRYVYHRLHTGAYERKTQLWRQSIGGWHTAGTEVVEAVAIDGVDASAFGEVGGDGSLTISTE
jgi:hypothetical protein